MATTAEAVDRAPARRRATRNRKGSGMTGPSENEVRLALKAAVDFSIDLRNQDPDRSWENGYVDV